MPIAAYGIHVCVNVVCATNGHAAAVLLRAGEPLAGHARMARLRGLDDPTPPTRLTVGPGRLAQALGLTLDHDGASLLAPPLTIHPPDRTTRSTPGHGPRVGITKAAGLPYRYFESDPDSEGPSRWVSPFRAGGRGRR